jgi:hypothetical protein
VIEKKSKFSKLHKTTRIPFFFTYKISPHFIFFRKNDGVLIIFSFLLLRPSKSSGASKKDPNFGFLAFGYALKN